MPILLSEYLVYLHLLRYYFCLNLNWEHCPSCHWIIYLKSLNFGCCLFFAWFYFFYFPQLFFCLFQLRYFKSKPQESFILLTFWVYPWFQGHFPLIIRFIFGVFLFFNWGWLSLNLSLLIKTDKITHLCLIRLDFGILIAVKYFIIVLGLWWILEEVNLLGMRHFSWMEWHFENCLLIKVVMLNITQWYCTFRAWIYIHLFALSNP